MPASDDAVMSWTSDDVTAYSSWVDGDDISAVLVTIGNRLDFMMLCPVEGGGLTAQVVLWVLPLDSDRLLLPYEVDECHIYQFAMCRVSQVSSWRLQHPENIPDELQVHRGSPQKAAIVHSVCYLTTHCFSIMDQNR